MLNNNYFLLEAIGTHKLCLHTGQNYIYVYSRMKSVKHKLKGRLLYPTSKQGRNL